MNISKNEHHKNRTSQKPDITKTEHRKNRTSPKRSCQRKSHMDMASVAPTISVTMSGSLFMGLARMLKSMTATKAVLASRAVCWLTRVYVTNVMVVTRTGENSQLEKQPGHKCQVRIEKNVLKSD